MQHWRFNKHSALRDTQRVAFAFYRRITVSALDHISMPWSLLDLGCSVNEQKGVFHVSAVPRRSGCWREPSLLCLDGGAGAGAPWCPRTSAASRAGFYWGCVHGQGGSAHYLSLIDLAELMRKTQENIYYKLLLNEADLN